MIFSLIRPDITWKYVKVRFAPDYGCRPASDTGLPTVAGCFAFGVCRDHSVPAENSEPFGLLTTSDHRVILRHQRELLCEFAEGRADVRSGIRDSVVHIDRTSARSATVARIGATEDSTEARSNVTAIPVMVTLVGRLAASHLGRPHL